MLLKESEFDPRLIVWSLILFIIKSCRMYDKTVNVIQFNQGPRSLSIHELIKFNKLFFFFSL